MNNTIAAIILTKNEERHIVRYLESIGDISGDIVIVDCFCSDRTVELAKGLRARFIRHPWKNHVTQINDDIQVIKYRQSSFHIAHDAQLSRQPISWTRHFCTERRVYAAA